jgi:hypothetical protein
MALIGFDGTQFQLLTPNRFAPATLPAFAGQRTASNQNLSASSITQLIFNNATKNIGTILNVATGLVTALSAGTYRVSSTVRLQNNASGAAVLGDVYFSKNGAGLFTAGSTAYFGGYTNSSSINASSNAFSVSGAALFDLLAGDTVAVLCQMGTIGGAGSFVFAVGSTFAGELLA